MRLRDLCALAYEGWVIENPVRMRLRRLRRRHFTGVWVEDVADRWWLVDGKPHRTDGPALISGVGRQEWWLNGKLHRDDGPAVLIPNGEREWWRNGVEYRVDGPMDETAFYLGLLDTALPPTVLGSNPWAKYGQRS